MTDPCETAAALRAEADRVLAETRILERLARFGTVHPTGSWLDDLLTRRDLDLCVATPEARSLADAIRRELASIPRVGSILLRDEYELETPGNPRGLLWCVAYTPAGGEEWNLDLLVAEPEEVERVLAPGRRFAAGLTEESRRALLARKAAMTRMEWAAYRRRRQAADSA